MMNRASTSTAQTTDSTVSILIWVGCSFLTLLAQASNLTSIVIKSPSEVTHGYHYIVCANKAIDQDAVAAQLAPAVDENTTFVLSRTEWVMRSRFGGRFRVARYLLVWYANPTTLS